MSFDQSLLSEDKQYEIYDKMISSERGNRTYSKFEGV